MTMAYSRQNAPELELLIVASVAGARKRVAVPLHVVEVVFGRIVCIREQRAHFAHELDLCRDFRHLGPAYNSV